MVNTKGILEAAAGIRVLTDDFYSISAIKADGVLKAALRAAREDLKFRINVLDREMSNAGLDQ